MKYNDFRKGDIVFCAMYGKGVIELVEDYGPYPVFVKFKDEETITYTLDGKILSDRRRTLYVIERKVGEEEVTKEFNRLLNDYSEKKFKYDEGNYFVNVILLENNEYEIALGNTKSLKEINKKYYYKEVAEEIIRKLKEFIK